MHCHRNSNISHKALVMPWPPRDDGPLQGNVIAVVLQAVRLFT